MNFRTVFPILIDLLSSAHHLERKGTFIVNLISRNSLLEMTFYQREMPFVDLTPSNSILDEKACGELTSFPCVIETMRSYTDRDASENTEIVGLRIQRQDILLLCKPWAHAPIRRAMVLVGRR